MRDNGRPTATAPEISKEEKIKEFILSYLAGQGGTNGVTEPAEVLLVAKSHESPVARAVASVAASQDTAFTLQVIFIIGEAAEAASVSNADVSLFADAVGVIDNTRLMDVHEQLVLGTSTVWCGDSMRREPSKRDAYEHYQTGKADAGRDARRAFARLWKHCTPLAVSRLGSASSHDNDLVEITASIEHGLESEKSDSVTVKPH